MLGYQLGNVTGSSNLRRSRVKTKDPHNHAPHLGVEEGLKWMLLVDAIV